MTSEGLRESKFTELLPCFMEESWTKNGFPTPKVSPWRAYHAMLGLEKYLHECCLEEKLLDLIKLRASQLNGCAYCLGHGTGKTCARSAKNEQRLYSLDAWRESPYYTDRRTALRWHGPKP